MINVGIKIGARDWKEKLEQVSPDFVEISYKSTLGTETYIPLLEYLIENNIPMFVHLSTSFFKDGDEFLINIASADSQMRNTSRKVLSDELAFFSTYKPMGYIIHGPTQVDFSREKGVFGNTSTQEYYEDSLGWVSKLDENIYIETSTAAIKIGDVVHPTLPFDQSRVLERDMKTVLDTGHMYTQYCAHGKMILDIYDVPFEKTNYFHIATLQDYVPHDWHGYIFATNNTEYPTKEFLTTLIQERAHKALEDNNEVYFVCEPKGGVKEHVENFRHLKNVAK